MLDAKTRARAGLDDDKDGVGDVLDAHGDNNVTAMIILSQLATLMMVMIIVMMII